MIAIISKTTLGKRSDIRSDIDNYPGIMRAWEGMKAGETMVLPEGALLPIHKGIEFKHKAIYFECGSNGVEIAPALWMECALHIEGKGSDTVINCPLKVINHFSGGLGVQDRDLKQVGIRFWAPVDVHGITVAGFYGTAVEFSGAITRNSNSSGSLMRHCNIGLCWRGIYIQGPDNNAIEISGSNSIRDSYGVGIQDDAMIGNYIAGNMLHMNRGGNIVSNAPHSRWIGNYSEGNEVPDKFGDGAFVIPGPMTDYHKIELYGSAMALVRGEIWTEANGHGRDWWKKKSMKKTVDTRLVELIKERDKRIAKHNDHLKESASLIKKSLKKAA